MNWKLDLILAGSAVIVIGLLGYIIDQRGYNRCEIKQAQAQAVADTKAAAARLKSEATIQSNVSTMKEKVSHAPKSDDAPTARVMLDTINGF